MNIDQGPYYRNDLAWIHRAAFGGHADAVAPGVLALLEPVLRSGGLVIELGCGGGALTRHLVAAGHRVLATDASEAFLSLARESVPQAEFMRLTLPYDPIPEAGAIVAVGHVFSYLATLEEIWLGLSSAAEAVTPGGLVVFDILDLAYGLARNSPETRRLSGDGWSMTVTTRLEGDHFVRDIETVVGEPPRTDHEVHRNLLVDVSALLSRLDDRFTWRTQPAFGGEEPTAGMPVVVIQSNS